MPVSVVLPAPRRSCAPRARALAPDGRGVPVGTNGYTTSWGPSLSGCPANG
ncbi:hypothetical protein MRU69_04395 [Kocuria flava]|uniref:hypothetical protein n=1 Tax=Kocuria flava TaxID=446860 RepID=UPI001FF519EF|nr:hypothetical protein [Kocuria flava]MCJ8504107.1 hypothetical protein [Kocuria flava]